MAGAVALLLSAVFVFALLRIGSELSTQSCVAEASAQFPAVPVSAFSSRATGALKVSLPTNGRARSRPAELQDLPR